MMPHHSESVRPGWNDWWNHPAVGRFADSAGHTGSALAALWIHAVLRGFELLAALFRGVIKVAVCLAAGAGAGLVTVGIFALRQPALWDYQVLQRVGPPLGPAALGAGVALLTAEALLIALFFGSWRRAGQAVR